MTDLDDVDRVLAGLGAVKPGAGMEARVLMALAQPEPRDSSERATPLALRQHDFRRWLSRQRRVVAIAAAAAMVLVVLPLVVHMRREAPRPAAGVLASGNGVTPALPRPYEPHAVEPHVAAGIHEVLGVRGTRSWKARVGKALPVAIAAAAPPQGALAESFPAPPMPLTRQERLLLRMLHGGETGELVAALAPGAETAVRSMESAQFRSFFRPVPVIVDPQRGAEKPLPDTGLDSSSQVVTPKVLLGDPGGEK